MIRDHFPRVFSRMSPPRMSQCANMSNSRYKLDVERHASRICRCPHFNLSHPWGRLSPSLSLSIQSHLSRHPFSQPFSPSLSNAIGPLFTASSSCPLHLHLTKRNNRQNERNLRFHRVKNRKLMHGYWRDKSRNLIQVSSRAVHRRRRRRPPSSVHPLPLSLSARAI